MIDRMNQVGFSQRISLEWLQYTANLVIVGNERDTISDQLENMLKDRLSVDGGVIRGSRGKTISILIKIWENVPSGLEGLRDAGLELLKTLPRDASLSLHWGMSMAVYHFLGAVAASPCLFPFNLDQILPGQFNASGRMEVIKHNLDEDLIFIKRCNS